MNNRYFPYDEDSAIQQLSHSISICRPNKCLVVKRHPFYPVPEQPPLYYGKRPCLPVVPTCLARGKVMVLGEYPNCRFATVTRSNGTSLPLVPVSDINEPFESGRYFNGDQVQLYPTGKSLQEYYLAPLGLDREANIWLTNVVKCFLLKPEHIKAYQALGWTLPKTSPSYNSYFKVATICMRQHLARELEICQPRLVIGLGEYVYRMMHSSDDLKTPAPDLHPYDQITGVPLRAGIVSHALDKRNSLFRNLNVIHLFHPSRLSREQDALDRHLKQYIPPTRQFIQELGL